MADTNVVYSAAQLTTMLAGILHCTSNEERRATETAVVRSLSEPQNLVQLVNVLCDASSTISASSLSAPPSAPPPSSSSAGVRQLAAVLLRKKIFTLWRSLDAGQQRELRQLLLARLGDEPVRVVRFAIAHIVTRLAKADANSLGEDGAEGTWVELPQAIRAAAEDPRAEMRELAMVLIYSFAEVFSEGNSIGALAAESVARGLADSDAAVQLSAVKATAVLLPTLELNEALYYPFLQQLVPLVLDLVARNSTSSAGHARAVSVCVSALDLVEQMLSDLSVKKNANLLLLIVQRLLDVLSNPSSFVRARQSCVSALSLLSSTKPKFVVARSLLQPMVECCIRLMAEDDSVGMPDNEAADDDDDDDDGADAVTGGNNNNGSNMNDDDDDDDDDMLDVQSSCVLGCTLLEELARGIPSKVFAPSLLPFIHAVTDRVLAQQHRTRGGVAGCVPAGLDESSPRARKSAVLALACLADGCPSYLRRRVGFVLEVVRAYFSDAHSALVRESAAFSLSVFCTALQPEILTHHTELLPMLVSLLSDASDAVRCRAAAALDTLCENIEEEMEPYIPVVLPAVVAALGGSSLKTQSALCGVISSIAMTRCPSLVSFAPSVLELLKQPFTAAATPETLPLRAQATETVGVIGAAIGKEAFAPYFPTFMHHVVVENLAMGSAALREHSFGFLANMCEVLREDFLPFLDDTIAAALHTVEEDTTVFTNKHLLAQGAGETRHGGGAVPLTVHDELDQLPHQPRAGGDDGGNDDDDDDADGGDDAQEIHLKVRTADVEEKCAAVYCIGVLAESLLTQFGMERVRRCWDPLTTLGGHYYPNVRSNVVVALAKLVKAAHGSGEVAKSLSEDTLAQHTRDMLDDLTHQILLPVLQTDLEKSVVGAACEAMEVLLKFFGAQCFPFGPDALVKECVQFLRQKKSYQLAVDFDAEDSDQDGVDGEDELFREAEERVAESPDRSWRDFVSPEQVVHGVSLADDHDDEVMDSAMSMLEALAAAYEAAFAPYAPYLVPLLFLYCDCTARAPEDVVTAVGTLAVVLEVMGSTVAEGYLDAAAAVSFSLLASSDESTARANSCYLLRVLIESCPQRFSSDAAALQQTLQALWQVVHKGTAGASAPQSTAGAHDGVVDEPEEIPEAVDNAISASCSLVRCCSVVAPSGSVSALAPMLPSVVPAMLGGVPMRLDKAENSNAIRTVIALLSAVPCSGQLGEEGTSARAAACEIPALAAVAGTAAAPWLPAMVACVARVFVSRTVEAAAKEALLQRGVAPFAAAHGDAWRAARAEAAAAMTPEQLAALQQVGY